MRKQYVGKWCREFENGKIDIRDDRSYRPSTSRTDVSATRVEELILANRRVTVRDSSSEL